MYTVKFNSLNVLNRVITCLDTCKREKIGIFEMCDESQNASKKMLIEQIEEINKALQAIEECDIGLHL